MNIAEMGFALHLQNEMCGVTRISGWNKETPSFHKLRGNVPERAPRYPSLETIIASHADLFIAGWNYGMNVGGDVTPERLARHHIPAIVLSESCLRQWHHPHLPVTLDALLYSDLLRLGRIFDRQDAAQSLVASMKARVAVVRARINGQRAVPVFIYDSGTDTLLTAGRYALASQLIALAGGRNIADDLPTNWGCTSWERVAMRQPEALIFVDYGQGVSQKVRWVHQQRLLQQSLAVRHHHYIALPYDALTPRLANIDAIEALARFLHPDQKM
ncbi:MAG: ABC transporter substrate-binding protein [Acetobacteraceae bacterium]